MSLNASLAPTEESAYGLHHAVVTAVNRLAPRYVRITFGGADLADLSTNGAAAKTKIILPPSPGAELVLPRVRLDHSLEYPEGAVPGLARTYTIRNYRPESGEVDIDFVMHSRGPAGLWASSAQVGDVIGVSDAAGYLPANASDLLFVADPSSLAAVETLIEHLNPAHASVRVILLARSHEDEVPLDEHLRHVPCLWVHAPAVADAGSNLAEAVRIALAVRRPEYVWVAGEAMSLKPVRRFLRSEADFAKGTSSVIGYWRESATSEAFEADLFARVGAALAAGTALSDHDMDEFTVED